ncbi:hypothetical protein AP064_01235 [Candidatus Liberibacter solanacearum]|uniref:Uncharacterized protein n=1 Tax=Candidatus Liberibacter solanacearum TaxID=556287 RepID=A0A0F4VKX4_9HYPH|nr:hypothetical protein [Candidatus Liberibacter solanacearum]KJZ80799.1 hypothetical protein KP07_02835 [Candidatus Liberibacter solanacearum]KJZ81915.1 hypothetical protein DJ66_0645 [Candidatus Liberibacter solanacearum]KQC49634.1 hypothetical protein AP064_01235 [Candidatus Liberibacter solanacearum]
MAKRPEQTVTRQEFNALIAEHKALSVKVDHINVQFKASEARDEKQQQGIEEILNILHTSKGLASFIKTSGAMAASLSAIIYALYHLKGWLHQ